MLIKKIILLIITHIKPIIKNALKNIIDKIKRWLFKKEIDDLKKMKIEIQLLHRSVDHAKTIYNTASNDYTEAASKYEEAKKLVNNIMDVGVDVGFHEEEHSWAVVCIAGKLEYVKFLPLETHSARELINYLKTFAGSRMIVDSPFAYKNIIKKELLL